MVVLKAAAVVAAILYGGTTVHVALFSKIDFLEGLSFSL